LNPTEKREALFSCLSTVLAVSMEKFKMETKKDCDRRAWGRLIVQGSQAYAKLLETVQLDELMKEIEAIKEKVGLKEA
jgi:hypothetical protein